MKQKTIPFLILAIFIVPWLLAYAYFNMQSQHTSVSGVQHGHLLEPVKPISHLYIHTNGQHRLKAWAGQWLLIYVSQKPCVAACVQQQDLLRRMQIALHKQQPRLQRFLIQPAGTDQHLADPTLQQATVSTAQWPVLKQLTRSFHEPLLLVDPKGNLMMRYGDVPAAGILKDIKRLLKVENG